MLLVLDGEGVWQVDPSTLVGTPFHMPLDPLTPASVVDALPQGDKIAGSDVADDLRVKGATMTSAFQLGLAEGATELATAYAKERQQFGKPIGQFQAIKHICADMISRVEVCRAAVYMAGVSLDDPEVGDPARAASSARIVANNTSSENGKDCVQVHGGMGYTWEVDAHLFVKRALGARHHVRLAPTSTPSNSRSRSDPIELREGEGQSKMTCSVVTNTELLSKSMNFDSSSSSLRPASAAAARPASSPVPCRAGSIHTSVMPS